MSGGRYGQTALCISFKAREMSKIVTQMLVMRPIVYSMKISAALRKSINYIKDLESKQWADGQCLRIQLV